MERTRVRSGLGLLAAAIVAALPIPARAQAAPPPAELARQIAALEREKAARTPAERKLSSRLLYEARARRGEEMAPGVAGLRTGVEVSADGTTLVDMRGEVTPRLLAEIERRGGSLVSVVSVLGALRARVSLADVEGLAALPELRSIQPADRALTRALDVSEGDAAHRAPAARTAFGVDGSGVAVGVLSDGVDALASLQASGDLPPGVTVLPGQAGSGNEGAAMLEIVHDLAPGASLLFATAFNGQASFAANIRALRAAGAGVIVDDVGYFAEGVFQDDDVAAAVDDVVADGALYFSAAGNEGNLDDGTAGVFEGDFAASGTTLGGSPAHDFGGGAFANTITVDSPYLFSLQWSDPLGGAANDYDLYLLNAAATSVLAVSNDVQNGDDDPFEAISSQGINDRNRRLAVVRHTGQGRFLHLNSWRGGLAIATAGQTSGHAAARGALGVAAVKVSSAGGPGGAFDGSESVETYSSDGPRRVFYRADGTPITPGNASSSGGELRAKPDLAAADCVSTAAPGFATFCGTSAAAPHAAGVAALLLELGAGVRTPEEIRGALAATALDIEAPGPDRDSGAGIADALAAAEAVEPPDCVDGLDNDGDGRVDYDPDPKLGDPGCTDASDPSERGAQLPCDDGLDNDGDGLVDVPGDPGCRTPSSPLENPACQDGVNNDSRLGIDFDGGASANQGVALDVPDPDCGVPWRSSELPRSCGLGFEVAPLLAALALLRRRRRSR